MSSVSAAPARRRLVKIPLAVQILLALALGVVLGLTARALSLEWLTVTLQTLGSTFVSLLQVTVVPLVFTAIVVSIASLRDLGRGPAAVARLGGKTLLWFATTAFISVLIGIATGLISNPGRGLELTPDPAAVEELAEREPGSWLDFVTGLVPSNLFAAFAEGAVLQVVVVSVLVGAAAYSLGRRAEPFVAVNRSILEIVQKVLWWLVLLAPIGVLGLIGRAVATYGLGETLAPLARLGIGVYVACLVVLVGVYPLLLRVFAKVRPSIYFRKVWPVLQFAFVSRSSGATLPLTRQTTINLGVDRRYADFAVPLGVTTKMDGCAAIYPAIATIFIAQVYGVPLSLGDYVLIALVPVVATGASAGVAGWFTALTLTLSTVGLPLEGIALVLAIDPILDMIRTATNVAGQITIPVLVARNEGLLDDKVLNSTERHLLDPRATAQPSSDETDSKQEDAEAADGSAQASAGDGDKVGAAERR
ncbi:MULTISPECIES: dicarboxylate/amino acid:cation symporter [Actinoalloteichus]|uniref:Na+/H+ dicarboxylate symporter n=1 Tax=Actinoalloteichus fjordicus TaxID=1612552 RepID=A0AAC9PUR9_9PSEU|nr:MULTISPECIES: dicarboxylate/amino acid:cation symporter [Actinoalloteichus]APU17392.1 Na+/H+ dicarboxylate symporter [Actinoalloteichus fjordicus]APU23476.1 Na+/H+ dicarboxylate symporter [Actinoalloteichus sp. GBA129-24]